ncbi:MAG TPA: hypothetical protein DIT01_21530, partial [Lentisphaeria bacterium]|nr:hypothetical protein [Lentisphaeria bacterium]
GSTQEGVIDGHVFGGRARVVVPGVPGFGHRIRGGDPLLNGNADALAFPIGATGPRQGVILAIVDTAFIDDGAATNEADK